MTTNEETQIEIDLLRYEATSLLAAVRLYITKGDPWLETHAAEELGRRRQDLISWASGRRKELTQDDILAEWDAIRQEHSGIFDQGILRVSRYSAVILLYTALEHGLQILSEFARTSQNMPVSAHDLRGDPFERCKVFFSKMCQIELTTFPQWNAVSDLEKVRHAIVHAGGRLDYISGATIRNRINQLAGQQGSGIHIGRSWGDVVEVDQSFIASISAATEGFLEDLVNEVGRRYL